MPRKAAAHSTAKRRSAGGRRKPSRRLGTDAELERRLRPVVQKLLDEMLIDRIDFAESEASLADGAPVPADAVWKRLGI